MSLIENLQIDLLKRIKIFFSNYKKKKDIVSSLDYFYFCPYGDFKGTSRLIFFFNKILAIKIYIIASIKDFYNLLKIGKFSILNYNKNYQYKTIVVNWGKLNDFDTKGNFYDKHFNVKSYCCPNTLWVIVYLDNKIPNNIANNIALIIKEKKIFNFKKIIDILLTSIFKKKNINFINQEFSYSSILSNFFLDKTDNFLNKNIKKIIMPYEGQPFQNSIISRAHDYSNKIETVGYIHSFPSGLPSNYVKRYGSPKKIIVTSLAQKFCFNHHLGWKSNKIKILPSSRYLKNNKIDMRNKIYLPIYFSNKKLILSSIKKIILKEKINMKNFVIKNHPHCLQSKKHNAIIQDIKEIITKNSFLKKNDKNDYSIFIGATASVIEALERNTNVYHICENPILESYNKKIWKYINSYSIDSNIFKYTIQKKNKLINLGKSINLYKTYFN